MKQFSTLPKACIILITGLLAWYASLNASFPLFTKIDADGYVHLKQLLSVFDGIKSLNLIQIYSFNLNTGFLYFLLHIITGLPFLISENYDLIIYSPRIVNSISLIIILIITFRIANHHLKAINALLLSAIPLTFSILWISLHTFKADLVMSLFLTSSLYFLYKDKISYSRQFWIAIALFSCALGSKTQALVFYPVIGLYCFFYEITNLNFSNVTTSLSRFFKAILMNLSIFALINPFILHPIGFYAFFRRLLWQTDYNNNSINSVYDLLLKTAPIYKSYLPAFLAIPLCILSAYLVIGLFKKNKSNVQSFAGITASFFLINMGYLFITQSFQHNNWALSYFLVTPLLLIPVLKHKKAMHSTLIITSILIIQCSFQLPAILSQFKSSPALSNPTTLSNMVMIKNTLSKQLNKETQILMDPNIAFNFPKYGTPLNNISFTHSGLQRYHLYKKDFDKKWKAVNTGNRKAKIFHTKDFIILNKNKENTSPLINDLISEKLNYVVLKENQTLIILGLKTQL